MYFFTKPLDHISTLKSLIVYQKRLVQSLVLSDQNDLLFCVLILPFWLSKCRRYKDIRCIVFVERVITAVVLEALLGELLPKYISWKTKYVAGNKSGLQSQTRKKQNEIVAAFREGLVWLYVIQM